MGPEPSSGLEVIYDGCMLPQPLDLQLLFSVLRSLGNCTAFCEDNTTEYSRHL